jgi:hypothetical protein
MDIAVRDMLLYTIGSSQQVVKPKLQRYEMQVTY